MHSEHNVVFSHTCSLSLGGDTRTYRQRESERVREREREGEGIIDHVRMHSWTHLVFLLEDRHENESCHHQNPNDGGHVHEELFYTETSFRRRFRV